MSILAINKRANYDYEISDLFEAGMVLCGHEVKSIKSGHMSLKGAFITTKKTDKPLPEVYLTNAYVTPYKYAGKLKDYYKPDRPRKLLLKKEEIKKLIGKKKEQGLTLVPTKIYTKKNLIKLEFGIGKGKRKYEKREDLKKKDVEKALRIITKTNSK
jgi:SsrA-binding protein